jgi:alpha-mannosidase
MVNGKRYPLTKPTRAALVMFWAGIATAPAVAPADPPRPRPRTERQWKVFVFHTSHCDPGWHDLPPKIMEKHAHYLDRLVELCDKTRNEPPERRFVFTYEHSWPVDYYERTRPKEKFLKLMEVCRRGQIEIGAIYASVHTELCGHEELARLTACAVGLRKRFGIPVHSAMLNDVSEGYTMGLPQVLARSGIRSIIFGPGVKAVVRGIQPDLPRLFQWTTPDGSGVLVGWTPGFWTYTTWSVAGYSGPTTLRQFKALGKGYPYDAIFRHGGFGDNTEPCEDMQQRLFKQRAKGPSIDVRMARVDDFAAYIHDHFSEDLPTFQGDNPNSWADGTISLARETGMHRRVQTGVIEAEKFAALDAATGGKAAYPAGRIADVYRDLHFYSDHTWGLDVGGEPTMDVNSPKYAQWQRNWDAKRAYPIRARKLTAQVRNAALKNMGARIRSAGPGVVVWNSCSWPRTDVVRLEWDSRFGDRPALVHRRSGKSVPWQKCADETGRPHVIFLARNIPPMGYAVYGIEQQAPAPAVADAPRARGNVLENASYRVTLDPKTGGVVSIRDKELQKELVDANADWPVNQYIHAHVDKGYRGKGDREKAGTVDGDGVRYLPDQVGPVRATAGPVRAALEVESRLTRGPAPATLRRRVVLYRGLKCIEFHNLVDKKASACKEQIYFAFPFAVPGKPVTRVELPYAMMRWDRDILPGCWRGYNSIQHWVDLSNEDYGVTFSPLEAPVVSLGGINSNRWDPKWHKTYVPPNGHVFSYIMSNIWNCCYALWQGGPVTFAYRVTSHRRPCDTAAAARFGWGHATPLSAGFLDKQAGTLSPDQYSAIAIDAPNVMATALKRADDGRGWIVRLYETGQRSATTTLVRINFLTPAAASLNTLSEEHEKKLELTGSAVKVRIKSNELLTVRVE